MTEPELRIHREFVMNGPTLAWMWGHKNTCRRPSSGIATPTNPSRSENLKLSPKLGPPPPAYSIDWCGSGTREGSRTFTSDRGSCAGWQSGVGVTLTRRIARRRLAPPAEPPFTVGPLAPTLSTVGMWLIVFVSPCSLLITGVCGGFEIEAPVDRNSGMVSTVGPGRRRVP